MQLRFFEKLVAHVNRKKWWHVPPRNPKAYSKRGQFLASSFREAEFWGRPLDEPLRVTVANPLISDEERIESELLGRRVPQRARYAFAALSKAATASCLP